MLAYLISRKQVPTKKGTMYFGTWIDHEGTYFDTAHFPDSLGTISFSGRWLLSAFGNCGSRLSFSNHYHYQNG